MTQSAAGSLFGRWWRDLDLTDDPALRRSLLRHPLAIRTCDLAGLASILLPPADKPDVSAQAVPTLVAVGSQDRVQTETAARLVVSRLTCEHELWVLPGGGHQLLLEHPRAAVPRIAAWLRRHL